MNAAALEDKMSVLMREVNEDPEFVTFMLKYGLDIRGTREQQLIRMEDA